MWRLEGHDHCAPLFTSPMTRVDTSSHRAICAGVRCSCFRRLSLVQPSIRASSNNELWGPDKIEIPALMVMIKESDRVIAELPGLMPNPESPHHSARTVSAFT